MKNDMEDERLRMMMLDIDGILTRYGADTTEVLAAAQQMAVSAIGDLINRGVPPAKAHPLADAVTEHIRKELHTRILEGRKPDW